MRSVLTQVPPEQLAFHNGDLHACRGEALRQKRPDLSGSDDDCVKLFLS
jgi:hypothetical protein